MWGGGSPSMPGEGSGDRKFVITYSRKGAFRLQWLRLRLGVAISRTQGLRTACCWLSAWQQAGAVHHGRGMAAIIIVRRFVIKSSLFTCKWVG